MSLKHHKNTNRTVYFPFKIYNLFIYNTYFYNIFINYALHELFLKLICVTQLDFLYIKSFVLVTVL